MDKLRCCVAAIVGMTLTLMAVAAEKPNIVLIMVDDLGYGDLACYGAEAAETPHLDTLMSEGMRFDQFYANCTVCTPTRASLLTGRYPDMVGAPGVIRQSPRDSWGYFRPNGPTLPALLKTAGYHTALIGKWHLGYESPNIPNDRGFDYFHGFLGDMMNNYFNHMRGGKNWMRHNREVIDPENIHASELFSNWAVAYLAERAKKPQDPFFLFLSYNAPHFPIQPPNDWYEKVREREPQLSKERARNVAFVEHTDHEIGRVLKSIKDSGLSKNTLIVFTSDNGGSLPHAASNGPLRGGKQDHWEGGIRVPTCVVWPGKVEARRSRELGMTMDLLPTLCEVAGVTVEQEIDGVSLAPIWLRGAVGDPGRTLIWVRREGNARYQGRAYYAIRKGDWKLLQNTPFEPMQLVNVTNDEFEKDPKPATGKVAKDLNAALMRHLQKAGAIPWQK